MKKLFALMLALVMMLTATCALAVTVTVEFKADYDVAQEVLPVMNVPAETVAQFQPIFSLLNKLGLKVITAGNAGQLDLNVGETTALSVGGKAETDILVGCSLVPSYLFKVTEEDVKNLMSQIPGFGGGQGGSFDPEAFTAIAQKVYGYVMKAAMPLSTAMQPGEPEQGSWEFEGYTFDVKTPIIVDTKAIGDAVKTLVTDLMSDEEIVSMIGSFGGNINPQDIIANVSEAMSEEHMPDVAVEVYQNTADPSVSYAKSEATYKGAAAPSYKFWMLQKADGYMHMELFVADANVTIALDMNGNKILAEVRGDVEQGQLIAVGFTVNDTMTGGQLDIFVAKKVPLLSIIVNVDQADGVLTLDLNEEGKTVLGIADLQGENSEAIMQGLQTELMTNVMQLMAIPELAQLIAMFTSGMSMGN